MADCVPDSSNAIEADEEVEDEQHSSGSVDEVGRFYFDNEKDLTDVLILTIPMQFKTGLNGAYTDTLLPLAKL